MDGGYFRQDQAVETAIALWGAFPTVQHQIASLAAMRGQAGQHNAVIQLLMPQMGAMESGAMVAWDDGGGAFAFAHALKKTDDEVNLALAIQGL